MSLQIIGVVVGVLWIGIMGYYLYNSQQQKGVEQQLERLRRQLDERSKKK